MKIILLLRTLIYYFLVGALAVIFVPPMFAIACLPEKYRYDNKLFFFFLDCFYKGVVFVTFNKKVITGTENLPKTPAIFVANHQSAGDIPVLGSLVDGFPHVWLVLAYYIKMPVLGFFVRRMFIPVDRAHAGRAARSLIQIYRFVYQHKRHVLIFPEGRRTTDGNIHEFFGGFAMLAKKMNRPVIPVFMPNNGKIYPPGSFFIYSYPLVITIGKPFYCGKDETERDFTERVRQWFIEETKQFEHDASAQ